MGSPSGAVAPVANLATYVAVAVLLPRDSNERERLDHLFGSAGPDPQDLAPAAAT